MAKTAGKGRSPREVYSRKRTNTRDRVDVNGDPIEFLLTFEEWYKVWEDSGHLGEWGRQVGQYCLSRYDDVGNYEVGNVFVQLHSENTAEMNRRRAGKGHPNAGKYICPQTYEQRCIAARKAVKTREERRLARKEKES